MNKGARARLRDLVGSLSEMKDFLEIEIDELQEKCDNIPESFEQRREQLEEEIYALTEAQDNLEEAISTIEDQIGEA
jgi:DNA-binding transcriptional MerR regulator